MAGSTMMYVAGSGVVGCILAPTTSKPLLKTTTAITINDNVLSHLLTTILSSSTTIAIVHPQSTTTLNLPSISIITISPNKINKTIPSPSLTKIIANLPSTITNNIVSMTIRAVIRASAQKCVLFVADTWAHTIETNALLRRPRIATFTEVNDENLKRIQSHEVMCGKEKKEKRIEKWGVEVKREKEKDRRELERFVRALPRGGPAAGFCSVM